MGQLSSFATVILTLSVLTASCTLCEAQTSLSPPAQTPCACPLIYSPVCATNGKTYSNDCTAKCEGVKVAKQGACPASTPVLPAPGSKSSNSSNNNSKTRPTSNVHPGAAAAATPSKANPNATAAGQSAQQPNGGKVCACPRSYIPVCGVDGTLFDNQCIAECAGVKVAAQGPRDGKCPSSSSPPPVASAVQQPCPAAEDVVCGSDGRNYLNPCSAEAAGVTVTSKGFCQGGGVSGKSPAPDEKPTSNQQRPAQQQQQQQQGSGTAKPACACPRSYIPVCADGKTFSNDCLAECEGFKKHTPGVCGSPATTTPASAPRPQPQQQPSKPQQQQQQQQPTSNTLPKQQQQQQQQQQPTSNTLPRTCACPDNLQPVCTQDGTTMDNSCFAECAGLSFVQGPCPGGDTSYSQGSLGDVQGGTSWYGPGSSWSQQQPAAVPGRAGGPWTGGLFGGPRPLGAMGRPRSPECFCGRLYLPVCGWDMVTYPSACIARCNGVRIARLGRCRY